MASGAADLRLVPRSALIETVVHGFDGISSIIDFEPSRAMVRSAGLRVLAPGRWRTHRAPRRHLRASDSVHFRRAGRIAKLVLPALDRLSRNVGYDEFFSPH